MKTTPLDIVKDYLVGKTIRFSYGRGKKYLCVANVIEDADYWEYPGLIIVGTNNQELVLYMDDDIELLDAKPDLYN